MTTVAIYVRYSNDKQSEASIDDQIRVCSRLMAERGWSNPLIYADAAISGTLSHDRSEYQRLISDAGKGRFEVIIAEHIDRISRDQEHIAGFYKRMKFLDIPIITVKDGAVNQMTIGFKGTMSAMFIEDLAQRTRRGLEGRVRGGKSAGGISYGYKVVREFLPDGSVTTGERSIDPDEADVIRRIFREYNDGLSARAIAAGLNEDGIPSPDSGKGDGSWGPSTISGNWKRGTGILNNELYIGRLVWNRQRFVKNPVTEKKVARLNPPEQWVIEEVSELRIVDDALWEDAKTRQGNIRVTMNPAGTNSDRPRPENARRPAYLLAGLMKCGCCGSSYTLMNKSRYGCAGARSKGDAVCTNRATILREEVEGRVLHGLRQSLLHPELIAAFAEEYRRAFNETAADANAERDKAKRDLAKAEKKIAGILAAIEDGMYHSSMKEKMAVLETEKSGLARFLDASPEPPALRLHPRMSDLYREKISALAEALNQPELKPQATELLRGLISEVRMVPAPGAPGGHEIELIGELAGILNLAEADMTKPPRVARAGSDTVVAGAGFTNCFA